MAETTINLSLIKSSFINRNHPDTAYPTSSGTQYHLSSDESMLFGFQAFPSNLRRNKLIGSRLRIYDLKGRDMMTYQLKGNWTAGSVTWNTKPTEGSTYAGATGPSSVSDYPLNWEDRWVPESGKELPLTTQIFLNGTGLRVSAYAYSSFPQCDTYIRTVLAGGGSPYVEVTYDNAVIVKSKVKATSYPSGSSVSVLSAQSFNWKLEKDGSDYCMDETWTQASAKLYWKAGSGSWNTINVSGNTMSASIPANTLPEATVISWYVQSTDTDGTTTSTETRTFTTGHSTISPTSYPSGNSVDNRYGQTFKWNFGSGYAQRSATLYWKAGSGSWNSINASGGTMNVTVPAYTFPTNSTITWYVSGTDTLGYTSSSSTYTFTVPAAAVSPTSFPSGSGISSGSALSFLWEISGTLGTYTQRSAVFYWKVSTAGSYTGISISNSTKRVTVAANTFPTGKTIQWYVSATDSSGVTTSSAAKSFSTAAPVLTPVTYPSGNSINFGQAISFSWKLQAASGGDYQQASAILYWRTSTSDPWSQLTVSGNTKSITAPAYTFPSNKTVSWYLSATDFSGTTVTSSEKTFKTASPQITPQSSPTSGYVNPRNAVTFSWYFTDGTNSYDQQSATLKWREQGASSWTSIAASGTTRSVTVAANTFPILKNIEWMLTGTDRGGTTSSTSVYVFSTTAATAYAVCQRPVGRVEDGTKPIVFTWTVRNADGTEPTRVIMKWKKTTEAGTEWRTVFDESEAIYTYTMAASTFPAGPIDWEIIAYNIDDVAGPASQASFVCVVAPDAPAGLSATSVPRTTISWQPTDQEAFEIEIDGEIVREAYGPDVTEWRKIEPLEDGVHTIRVRIQGPYGLWSEWAETTVSIENVPDGTVSLTGEFHVDGDLEWTYTGAGDPEAVAVYRDGKRIGSATGKTAFTDRFVLGEHVYRVEYWYADGNYTRSNEITGKMSSETLRIAEFNGGAWMCLKLSNRSDRVQNFSWSQLSAAHRITGSPWPLLETGPYETLIGKYECAFRSAECIRKFEQLRGKTVILKSRNGIVVIGGLMAMEKSVTEFYTTFSFSVQQNCWEDFVNDDADD